MQDGECLPKEEWLARSNKCVITTNEAECKGNNSCTWDEEVGECSLRSDSAPTPTPIQPGGTPQQNDKSAPAPTPQDETTPVTLNLTFADKTNTVKLPATIECKYTNKKGKKASKKKTAKQDGKVTLSEVPLNAECTIAAVNCTARTDTAKTLSGLQQFVPLKCEIIDKCFADGNKWENNKCVENNDLITIAQLKIDVPKGLNVLPEITIKCDNNKGTTDINSNTIITIKKMPPKTKCTISAKHCESYTDSVANLKQIAWNRQSVKLACPEIENCLKSNSEWTGDECIGQNVELKWQTLSGRFKLDGAPIEINNIKCGSDTLSEQNQSITVPRDTQCEVHLSNRSFVKYTAYNLRRIDTFNLGSKKKITQ